MAHLEIAGTPVWLLAVTIAAAFLVCFGIYDIASGDNIDRKLKRACYAACAVHVSEVSEIGPCIDNCRQKLDDFKAYCESKESCEAPTPAPEQ